MVPIKSHTAIVRTCTQEAGDDGIIRDPVLGEASEAILVYFEPMSPGQAYKDFFVELKQPGLIMCDLPDEPSFSACAVVTLTPIAGGGAVTSHQVVSYPGRSDVGQAAADADHAEIVLRRLQFPPAVS